MDNYLSDKRLYTDDNQTSLHKHTNTNYAGQLSRIKKVIIEMCVIQTSEQLYAFL